MSRNLAIVFLLLVVGAAFVAYRIGYSLGQDEPLSQTRGTPPAETETGDFPVEDPAVAELKEQVSACRRALSWYIPQFASAEGMARAVKNALVRGDNSAAEDTWNDYLYSYNNEYYVRNLRDDVVLCGLPNKYVQKV